MKRKPVPNERDPKKPRAERSSREEVDARVAYIGEMMAKGQWLSQASVPKLAAEWNIARRTVRDYSRMASRLLWNDDAEDLHLIKTCALSRLELLSAKAEAKGQFGSAVAALSKLADIAGIKRPTVVLSTGVTLEDLDTLRAAIEANEPRGAPVSTTMIAARLALGLAQDDEDSDVGDD